MKRFYVTSSPVNVNNPSFLLETEKEAIEKAKADVAKGSASVRFVVQILYRVERAVPPVRVSRVKR